MKPFLRALACTLLLWVILCFTLILVLAIPDFLHAFTSVELFQQVLRVMGEAGFVAAPLAILIAVIASAVFSLMPEWKTRSTWLAGVITGPIAALLWIFVMVLYFGGPGPSTGAILTLIGISTFGSLLYAYGQACLLRRAKAAREDPRFTRE